MKLEMKPEEFRDGVPVKYGAGAVARSGNKVLMIVRPNGTYGFPKGHINYKIKEIDGVRYMVFLETAEKAAVRETYEETGYRLKLAGYIGHLSRIGSSSDGGPEWKEIELFGAVVTEHDPPMMQEEEEAWVGFEAHTNMLAEDAECFVKHWGDFMALPDSVTA